MIIKKLRNILSNKKKKVMALGILSVFILAILSGIIIYKHSYNDAAISYTSAYDPELESFFEAADKTNSSEYNKFLAGDSSTRPSSNEEDTKGTEFTKFEYNLNDKTGAYDKVGGFNNYALDFPNITNKSTFKDLIPSVNKAVCYLTQGAYPEKIKSKFLGKTYRGMQIKDVKIEFFKVPLTTENVNEYLENKGAFNLPKDNFASVMGDYEPMDNSADYIGYVKCTVILD